MTSLPSVYSAEIVPPICSIKVFVMDRPRPVEQRAVSTVKKRLNSFPTWTSSSAEAWFEKQQGKLLREGK